jgi:CRISPR-associated endonuclease/helicase Cas3
MTKLYNKYWGKAENDALKVAYCSGSITEKAIFEKFKPQLAKNLKKSENQLQLSDLDDWAKKEDKKTGKGKWEYKQANYAAYHLLPYHCLDVAAVGKVLLDKNVYLTQCLSRLTGINEEILKPVLLFFLVLHDRCETGVE